MKFLQLATFSGKYLGKFYAANPDAGQMDYRSQLDFLLRDGFGAGHMLAEYMAALGHEPFVIIANCAQLQYRWAKENGVVPTSGPDAAFKLVGQQIERIRPEIIYTSDPITFDSGFFRMLSYRPKIVCGWRAAGIPEGVDFSEFAFLVSNSRVSLEEIKKHGARASEYFFPGFPKRIATQITDTPKEWDVFFCGQWTDAHRKRNGYLLNLAKAPLLRREQFSIGYFLSAERPEALPAGVAMHNRGELWGLDMLRGTRSGRIVLNATIDYAGDEAGNMRGFEVTGAGSFLLTEHHDNLAAFFTPGSEVETYRNSEELIEKVVYYLEHPVPREDIARRGQERCLRDYSMEGRAEALDKIIRKYLPVSIAPSALSALDGGGRRNADIPAAASPSGTAAGNASELGIRERYPGVSIGGNVQMLGIRNIAIGDGSCIGEGTWLNICQRDESIRMSIGKMVLIGRHSMISTGGNLEIGDFNVFAPRVYVSDADHIYADIARPVIEQGATLGRSLIVEENCWLGINVVISGNLEIGFGSVIAANSVVLKSVPPLCVMGGNPARILKLYNPKTARWEDAREEADQIRILEDRQAHPLPDREEYRKTLWKNSRMAAVDPILTGDGKHIF